jgi:hypothetical protein
VLNFNLKIMVNLPQINGETSEQAVSPEVNEIPSTVLGERMVQWADHLDKHAGDIMPINKEWAWWGLAVGALSGAAIIAIYATAPYQVDAMEKISELARQAQYTGSIRGLDVNNAFGRDDWEIYAENGVRTVRGGIGEHMSIGKFARALVEGKFTDYDGQSVFLLHSDKIQHIFDLVEKLDFVENLRDKASAFLQLGAIGSLIASVRSAKQDEKLVRSVWVEPTLAKLLRKLVKSLNL